jgi:16S rRNA G966 N2-methylase RsmD
MLRIISGTAGGIRIKAPDTDKTRPTLERVKESVFGMLQPYIPGARVLDLFAGWEAWVLRHCPGGLRKRFL